MAPARGACRRLASAFCSLFAAWVLLVSAAALMRPAAWRWLTPTAFPHLLGLLMFSVGMTTGPDDFRACLRRPKPILLNLFACFVLMPALALAIARLATLPPSYVVGVVLIAGVNGGQASNLCTLIAGGDVALSVLMTVSTTLVGIVATPLLATVVLGTLVPVDAVGILHSAVQVVLLPVCSGVFLNMVAPRACQTAVPFIPVVGVVVSVLVIGATVASCQREILDSDSSLHAALVALHAVGAVSGHALAGALGGDDRERRTVAIEVSMKSAAFSFVLAVLHFGDPLVRVPSAADCIWCPLVASLLAAAWKKARVGGVDTQWAAEYKA